MFFSERKREAEAAAREAAGESLWTEHIPRPARVRIAAEWQAHLNRLGYGGEEALENDALSLLKFMVGATPIRVSPNSWQSIEDTDVLLTQLEAVIAAFNVRHVDTTGFQQWINDVFASHRVAFKMVDREFVPISSDELHVEVVEPALRLLADSRFTLAHDAYMKALKEIANDDPGDSITDAATALQETLNALGVRGGSLGAQWTNAKKQGLLTGHDQRLADGIDKFVDWASAERNTNSDAHKHTDADRSDAWLMVHVVGALIVRLAGPRPRSTAN